MKKTISFDPRKKIERRNKIIRRILYFLVSVIFYILITTVGSGRFTVPLLLIPAAVAAAIFEAESALYSAVYGCFCGLLLDLASGTLISFSGIITGACSLFTSLLFMFYLRRKFFNFMMLDCLAVLLQSVFHYLFFYLLWGYDDSGRILSEVFIPEFLSTAIFGAGVYGLFRLINYYLGNLRDVYVEDDGSAE